VRGYTFESYLGRGGSGICGKYRSTFNHQSICAIKFLKIKGELTRASAEKEVKIFSKISLRPDFPKESLVTFKDAYIDEEYDYLVMIMEYAEKGNL